MKLEEIEVGRQYRLMPFNDELVALYESSEGPGLGTTMRELALKGGIYTVKVVGERNRIKLTEGPGNWYWMAESFAPIGVPLKLQ